VSLIAADQTKTASVPGGVVANPGECRKLGRFERRLHVSIERAEVGGPDGIVQDRGCASGAWGGLGGRLPS